MRVEVNLRKVIASYRVFVVVTIIGEKVFKLAVLAL